MNKVKIDGHIHLTPEKMISNWRDISKKEFYWNMLCESKVNKFTNAEGVLNELRNSNFDNGVVFGFSFNDQALCMEVNEYTIKSVKKHSELIGFMSISPKDKNISADIDRCLSKGLKGVGELFLEGQDIIDIKVDLKNIMGIAKEAKIPVMIHVNESIGHYYPGKVSTSLNEAYEIVSSFPDNKIILSHFGGGLIFYECLKDYAKISQNVYYDTAAANFTYKAEIFNMFKDSSIIDKLIFGTDFPILSIERHKKFIEKSNLSQEELDKIFGINLKKLLD